MAKHAPQGPNKAKADLMRDHNPTHGNQFVVDPLDGWRGCGATTRSGQRCKGQAIRGGHVCRMHGGAAPQVKFAAMERLRALQPKAVTVLDGLLSREEFPTVQMAAVRDVLDRTEGKAVESMRVDMSVNLKEETLKRLFAGRQFARKALNP